MAYLTDHLILAIGRCDSPEKLEEMLAKFFTEYSALELLDERLGSSDEALASCASKSYVHVNGFQKLVIAATSTSGPQIRLHRWIGASQRSHIHDHSWHFASLVLKGRLEVSDFLEVDEGSQMDMASVSSGLLFNGGIGGEVFNFTTLIGMVTVGNPDLQGTFGMGYAWFGGECLEQPAYMLNGLIRIGSKWYVVTDNILLQALYTVTGLYGVRIMLGTAGLDIGISRTAYDSDFIMYIPVLGVTVPF